MKITMFKKRKKMIISLIIMYILIDSTVNMNISSFALENSYHRQKIEILKVFDGDTVKAKIDNGEILNIRLNGIDCYETSAIHRAYKQAYTNNTTIEDVIKKGSESEIILKSLVRKNKNNIYMKFEGIDKYSRALGTIFINDMNVNEYMVNKGGCFVYIYKKNY